MSQNRDGLRRATHIFEAAAWHYAVRVICSRCPHSAAFNPHGLWWRFERKGWDDHLGEARAKFWCRECARATGRRVRPARLQLVVEQDSDVRLEMPSESEWKRALSRFRS